MKYSLCIFDLDGVILDSKEANRHYYNDLLKDIENRFITQEELDFVHSLTVDEALEYLFKSDPQKITLSKERLKTLSYSNYLGFLKFEEQAERTLDELKGLIKLALCTNRTTTMPILQEKFNLKRWFDVIITALDVKNPKPHPEGINTILDLTNTKSSATIYIGDSHIDELTAQNAHIDFIAYKNPKLRAKYHICNLTEIKDIMFEKSI